jgi:hypothetical protein
MREVGEGTGIAPAYAPRASINVAKRCRAGLAAEAIRMPLACSIEGDWDEIEKAIVDAVKQAVHRSSDDWDTDAPNLA